MNQEQIMQHYMAAQQQASGIDPKFLREVKIDEKVYSYEVMMADDSWDLAMQLAMLAGPAITSFLETVKQEAEEEESYGEVVDSEILSNVVMNLIVSGRGFDFKDACSKLLYNVSVNGIKVDYRNEFRGDLGAMQKVVCHALKENCGDFFMQILKSWGLPIPSLSDLMAQVGGQKK